MTGPADAEATAGGGDDAAAVALTRAEAAGVVLRLGPDGRVTLTAPQPPGEVVLAGLRRHRDGIAAMLAAAAEGKGPPGDPDPLRDGLLAGWRASRSGRLFALAERLEAARPRRAWGVRELDWRAWEDAARDAADLPGAAWSSWRATGGTAAIAWPPRGITDRNGFARAGDHGP